MSGRERLVLCLGIGGAFKAACLVHKFSFLFLSATTLTLKTLHCRDGWQQWEFLCPEPVSHGSAWETCSTSLMGRPYAMPALWNGRNVVVHASAIPEGWLRVVTLFLGGASDAPEGFSGLMALSDPANVLGLSFAWIASSDHAAETLNPYP